MCTRGQPLTRSHLVGLFHGDDIGLSEVQCERNCGLVVIVMLSRWKQSAPTRAVKVKRVHPNRLAGRTVYGRLCSRSVAVWIRGSSQTMWKRMCGTLDISCVIRTTLKKVGALCVLGDCGRNEIGGERADRKRDR